MIEIGKAKLLWMYERMRLIRNFEDRVADLFGQGRLPGFAHLYAGEEAIAVGVMAHLTEQDWIISTHRGHGHCISKGMDVKAMMAELHGKATGSCKGKGGSMHIADKDKWMLGANGIVGAGAPMACGSALTAKVLGTNQVTVCFYGDGASEQGTVHEAMNLASIGNSPLFLSVKIISTQYPHPALITVQPVRSAPGLRLMTFPEKSPTAGMYLPSTRLPGKPLIGQGGVRGPV